MKLSSLEDKIREWFVKRKDVLFLIVLVVMSVYVRYKARDFASSDYNNFLLPWFQEIQEKGFSALKTQIGDYPIPYQVLILLLTKIPGNPMYLYKTAFFLTDIIQAIAGGTIVKRITGRQADRLFTIGILLVLPEVVLNSAYWSQCDSVWSGFVLLAVLCLMDRKYFLSFVFLGVAFSFKMQTVFIFPLFVMYYFKEGGFSIFSFLIIPLVFLLLCSPAFIAGRPVTSFLSSYFMQVYEYDEMVISFPSFWALTQLLDFKAYYRFGVMVTFAILGVFFYVVLRENLDLKKNKSLLLLAAISSWTCVLFLPSMHERYGYLSDILLVILIILDHDYLPFGIIPPIVSIISYGCYLTGGGRNLVIMAGAHMIAYLGVIVLTRMKYKRNPEEYISA